MLEMIPDALAISRRTLTWFKGIVEQFREEIRTFGNFPSLFMGLVTPNKPGEHNAQLEHYDGVLRFVDASGNIVADQIPSDQIRRLHRRIRRAVLLSQIPLFQVAWAIPRAFTASAPSRASTSSTVAARPWPIRNGPSSAPCAAGSFLVPSTSTTRASIEILYGIERIEQLLNESDILDKQRARNRKAKPLEGIGVSEAPRGTLMHHYKIDENGLITWVNMIIATGHNNLAMNRSVKQVAQHYVKSAQLQEGMLNRVEAVIRTYDPCLSCSTHAFGQMPLHIQLLAPDGSIVGRDAALALNAGAHLPAKVARPRYRLWQSASR